MLSEARFDPPWVSFFPKQRDLQNSSQKDLRKGKASGQYEYGLWDRGVEQPGSSSGS
jgi:hypothetical protein